MQTIPANSPDQVTRPFRDEDGRVDVGAIREQLLWSATQGVGEINRGWRNENTRFCRWPGQRDDGRKGEGAKVEPWPHASDVRIRLADGTILDDVALMLTAADGRLTIDGTESGAMSDAMKTGLYLDWLRNVKMKTNVEREIALAAEGRQTYGYMVMSVTWKQKWARGWDTIKAEDLTQQAQQEPGGAVAQLITDIFTLDGETQRAVIKQLQEQYPDLTRRDGYAQLAAFRNTGEMKLPVRTLLENEPVWRALRPWRDWWAPLNTFDSKTARWQAEREVLNAQELDAKRTEGWSEDFIEKVRGTMGYSIIIDALAQRSQDIGQPYRDRMEEMRGLCEVFYVYYWHTDKDGLPTLWRTVCSPWLSTRGMGPASVNGPLADAHGPDEPVDEDGSKYPYIFMPTEMTDRYFVDARGRPETLLTQQSEIKHERDARNNQTDLALQPPLVRPEREVGLPLTIKPRGEIGFRRTGQTEFMTVPQQAQGAAQLEQDARNDAQRYLARDREEDPVRADARQRAFLKVWTGQLAECWKRTLELAQQYMDLVEFQTVTGGQTQTIRISREEIQGSPHLKLTFNSDTMDPERMEGKVKTFGELIGMNDGTIKAGPIIEEFIRHFFPEVAEAALRTGDMAAAHEIKDTADTLGRILGAGIEPDYADKGQNFPLRLQWLQQQVQQPATQQTMQQSPAKAALVHKYGQHLAFMVQQQQNAQTGRTGVAPAPGGGVEAAA